jgi:hypothetical protein
MDKWATLYDSGVPLPCGDNKLAKPSYIPVTLRTRGHNECLDSVRADIGQNAPSILAGEFLSYPVIYYRCSDSCVEIQTTF